MRSAVDWIDAGVQIPDLLRRAPQVRPVLDRYGLRGCGGPLGPAESVGFFAQAHEVSLPQLLDELRAASGEKPAPPAQEEAPSATDAIYRPFFKAGIAVTLTLGAVWGAYLLLRIAVTGSFTSAGLHEVNAHGHAQIFGWVGLFVMGFAYQAFPRFKQTTLARPALAWASFGLMLAGLALRSVLEPLAAAVSWAGTGAVAGAVLEIAAIGLFVWVVLATWKSAPKPLAFYDSYILCSMGWFVVQAVYEAVYLAATLQAADREALIRLVSTWQGALRDVQIHGFALLMILGVSQRMLPHFYGLPAPSRRLSLVGLAAINLAVVGEALGLILHRTAGRAWVGLWYASALLLAVTVTALLADWRAFARAPQADRSLKFVRASYGWLLLSLAMLVLLPAHQFGLIERLAPASAAAQIHFSHAYSGAVRHAITVGFVSLMIVGVAAKVVPTLNGVEAGRLPRLWLPFVLLNAGCALRVGGQVLTDFVPSAFPVTGASGVLEVCGLAVWGAHLWRVMAGRFTDAPEAERTTLAGGAPVEARHRVGDVLDQDPELLSVFLAFGFRPLANPLLRRSLARRMTIAQACALTGTDAQALLAALNTTRLSRKAGRLPLTLAAGG